MDPELHDAPLYVQTLAWVCLIAVVAAIVLGGYMLVRGAVDTYETYDAGRKIERNFP